MPPPHKPAGTIVCNAGPLIALAGIKQLPLLQDLYSHVQVAEGVFRELTGTGGILLAAKRAGLVKQIRPLMQQMRANGYFLSVRLVEGLCQAAGE